MMLFTVGLFRVRLRFLWSMIVSLTVFCDFFRAFLQSFGIFFESNCLALNLGSKKIPVFDRCVKVMQFMHNFNS